jgi:two-component system, OmpR family, response regulator MtrA
MMHALSDWGDDSCDVLLVGGESDAAEMYRMKLQLDGYRVITTSDADARSRRRIGWKPDIVLMDLGTGSGAPLRDLERLRADPRLADVPVLLLSSRSEEELRQRGVRLGPTDYLVRAG